MAWSVSTWKIRRIFQSQFLFGEDCCETRHSSYTLTLAKIWKDLMKKRKIISLLFLLFGVVLSVAFILGIEFPQGFEAYFKREYYNQFGPLAISVELLIAGYYFFVGH
tara:strand:+ start:77678 stop:78001 length:324 start_codon:yes stop_codon:yes gene_type:complete